MRGRGRQMTEEHPNGLPVVGHWVMKDVLARVQMLPGIASIPASEWVMRGMGAMSEPWWSSLAEVRRVWAVS